MARDQNIHVKTPWQSVIYIHSSSPHVALLPGDDVKHSGDEEEGAQAHAVHPGGDPLPAVVRQAMQQSHADDGRHDEELRQGGKKTCLKKKRGNDSGDDV